MSDCCVKADDLRWDGVRGEAAGSPVKKITSEGEKVLFTTGVSYFAKMSKIERRRVEAVWREVGPVFSCVWDCEDTKMRTKMIFVDDYLYSVVVEKSPFVLARTKGGEPARSTYFRQK